VPPAGSAAPASSVRDRHDAGHPFGPVPVPAGLPGTVSVTVWQSRGPRRDACGSVSTGDRPDDGSGGRIRTYDPRINRHGLIAQCQELECSNGVKPATADQWLTGGLSNRRGPQDDKKKAATTEAATALDNIAPFSYRGPVSRSRDMLRFADWMVRQVPSIWLPDLALALVARMDDAQKVIFAEMLCDFDAGDDRNARVRS